MVLQGTGRGYDAADAAGDDDTGGDADERGRQSGDEPPAGTGHDRGEEGPRGEDERDHSERWAQEKPHDPGAAGCLERPR